MITSLPVSVLSNARKRNISSELISGSQDRPQDLMMNPGLLQEAAIPPLPPHTGPVVAGGGAGGETAQEKKWNAEFNQVLQTVIEQDRADRSKMDWSAVSPANLQETKTVKEPVMEWCTNTNTNTDKTAAAAPSLTSVPVLSIPETTAVNLDIISPAVPPGGTLLAQPSVTAVSSVYQEVPEDSPAQAAGPPGETNTGPGQLLFEVRNYYSESQTEAQTAGLADSYSQDLAPIQGDPLLSEASVCIELQKSIEAASVNSPEQSQLGSEIPRDQQWVNTPQTTDWT